MFGGSAHDTPHKDKALPPLARNAVAQSPRTKVVAEVFNMFDLDGSGEIELDEIARAFRTMGKLTDETLEQLKAHFNFMDSDGSGDVTFDEFRAALGLGEISFRNYQHQQVYNSLGLTLCQNLMVYRRHVLHQELEKMQKSGSGTILEQFECLARALLMSTFAIKLNAPERGGGGRGAAGARGREGTHATRKGALANNKSKEQRQKEEAKALERVVWRGQRRGYLRPLAPTRQRKWRNVVAADVAAINKARCSRDDDISSKLPQRKILKQLQAGPGSGSSAAQITNPPRVGRKQDYP